MLEASSIIKENTLLLYLIVDDLSLRYFHRVKRELSLKQEDKAAIFDTIYEFTDLTNGYIEIYKHQFKNDDAIVYILDYCLEPMDSIHLAIAKKRNAEFFVTRDRIFLEKKIKRRIKEDLDIETVHPKDMLKML